ncbi:MarR family winged helix-turn-helix transcriptional regulator [Afifella sp. IM 167]|uniref:MarR family winged helix-turn-helix transcriptional regulator n=1 Tax=Afifella sp. IM 167 TaxID=2033586 RepID=UPI001CCBCC70|nr:MarR family transcriptional regulator [Afifella sp. IM 167]MBZ8132985.1 MarR family transcriptional regulator [Afifella sp. IM 167]
MANNFDEDGVGSLSVWAKRCYLAGRALMEDALRPHGLGTTQYYVLHRLATAGPTMQRDFARLLQVERATMSIVIAALVKKGLVEQIPDAVDQRQKLLRLTAAGAILWKELPDLGFIRDAAFGGLSETDIQTAARVLRTATERLQRRLKGDMP